MTSLNSHLPLEVVKSNKSLQGIETRLFWTEAHYDDFILVDKDNDNYDFKEQYPAPTLADCIDNAEELFGKEMKKEDGENWYEITFERVQFRILRMCQRNKTIEEIAKYITDNLK